jgi:glycosyltransferase involved in cell wall biosynthesis
MKVGVFLEDFSPEVGGGYTIQADIFRALMDLIDETSHSFVLFCRRPERFPNPPTSPRLQAVAFPGTLGPRLVARAQSGISALVENRKRQTRLEQLCKEAGVEFMWFVGAEAVQVDLPYMAIVWDLQHRLQPWFPEVSAGGTWNQRETFYGEYLRRATYIIAGTEAGRREIQRFYQVTSDRIKILPHPTPSFALNAGPIDVDLLLKKYGVRSGNYLFYPAQFWSHKNHANLLLAVARLKHKYQIDLPVVLVGSDKGNEDYVRTLATQIEPSIDVRFFGFVPLDALEVLYRGAFALSYVTFFGPENLPPLEAFALGCPVIASDVSGAREQLGDAALFVDPRSPRQIAAAIKSLQDEGLRRSLIDKGRARAERWTAKDFVRGVFAALDEFEPVRRCWR